MNGAKAIIFSTFGALLLILIGANVEESFSAYFVGAGFLLFALVFVLGVFTGWAATKTGCIVMSLIFGVPGIACIVLCYGYNTLGWRDYRGIPVAVFLMLIFYIVPFFKFLKLFQCREKVMAECVEWRESHSKGGTLYTPVFSYMWDGRFYQHISTGETISKRKIRKYVIGEEHRIYLNKKSPMLIMTDRRIDGTDMICFCMATGILIMMLENSF